jgi:hypothetical protein
MKNKILVFVLFNMLLLIHPLINHSASENVKTEHKPVVDSLTKKQDSAVASPFGTPIFSIHACVGPLTPLNQGMAE